MITLMWSQTGFNNSRYFSPNHFVPFLRVSESEAESTVTVDDFEEIEQHTRDKFGDLEEEESDHDAEVSFLRADPDLEKCKTKASNIKTR